MFKFRFLIVDDTSSSHIAGWQKIVNVLQHGRFIGNEQYPRRFDLDDTKLVYFNDGNWSKILSAEVEILTPAKYNYDELKLRICQHCMNADVVILDKDLSNFPRAEYSKYQNFEGFELLSIILEGGPDLSNKFLSIVTSQSGLNATHHPLFSNEMTDRVTPFKLYQLSESYNLGNPNQMDLRTHIETFLLRRAIEIIAKNKSFRNEILHLFNQLDKCKSLEEKAEWLKEGKNDLTSSLFPSLFNWLTDSGASIGIRIEKTKHLLLLLDALALDQKNTKLTKEEAWEVFIQDNLNDEELLLVKSLIEKHKHNNILDAIEDFPKRNSGKGRWSHLINARGVTLSDIQKVNLIKTIFARIFLLHLQAQDMNTYISLKTAYTKKVDANASGFDDYTGRVLRINKKRNETSFKPIILSNVEKAFLMS